MYLERVGQLRYMHHRARTVDGALEVLRKWPQDQYRDYSLGYVGFHEALELCTSDAEG